MAERLVIFDCDGVLVDSEPLANRVFREMLASVGVRMTLDEVMREFVGRTQQGCLDHAGAKLGRPLPPDFLRDWSRLLFETFARELKAVEGVADLIAALRHPYCVASNSTGKRVRVSLAAVGLLERFEGRLYSADLVARPKPAPDLFLHAANSLGYAPAQCTVIEDSTGGVRAAQAAGMKVLAYAGAPHADRAALREAGAEVFDTMAAIARRLN